MESEACWERETLEKLLNDTLTENRRKRRWGVFFKLAYLALVVLFVLSLFMVQDGDVIDARKSHAGVVDISGPIMPKSDYNADAIVAGLQSAFKAKNSKAVILRINSPGGTPVQSSLVYDEIMRLKAKYPNKKIHAVCTDLCASGAYFIASAADDIYANQSSLVGSIGVIMSGFGFVDGMKKVGIERRLITAGKNKGFLDPFSPVNEQEKQKAITMINGVHQQFIDAVKKGRGKRLKIDDDTFSGLVWNGQQALKLGLIDGFASPGKVVREIVKTESIVDYTNKPDYLKRIAGMFS